MLQSGAGAQCNHGQALPLPSKLICVALQMNARLGLLCLLILVASVKLTNPSKPNAFGKNKTQYLQPPQVPPKRNGNTSEKDQAAEQEEEDEDMYEPPPSNAQDRRKPSTPKKQPEGNVCSGRAESSPGRSHPQHSSRPVKLPGMQSTIIRKGKGQESHAGHISGLRHPDVATKPAPPSATDRRLSLPCSMLQPPPRLPMKPAMTSSTEDLYLIPIPEKGSTEDIYLECNAGPAPASSKPTVCPKGTPPAPVPSRPPTNTKPGAAPGPNPRPPKAVPALLQRMPPPNMRILLPSGSKSPKPKFNIPGLRPLTDTSPEGKASTETGSCTEDPSVLNKPWYGGHCDRNTAESALQRTHKDGAFMVRDSSGQSCNQPYTLVVLHKGRVYNIPIRSVEGGQKYALGKEGKNHEELFPSVVSIVQHYQDTPLVLIGNCSSAKQQTCLLCPVKP